MINNYNQFSSFVALSLALHLVVLYIIFFGLHLTPKPLPITEEVQVLELLPISSVNNVKTQKVQKSPTIKSEDAKQTEKSKVKSSVSEQPKQQEVAKPEEEASKEEPKPEEAAPKPKQLAKNESKPEEVIKPAPVAEKKEETKKSEPAKNIAKETDVKKKLPTDKEISSLLKNLEQASEGKNNQSEKRNIEKNEATYDAFGNFDETKELSLTNDEIIKQQILKHWNKPVASVTENIIINVHLQLLEDGTINQVTITNFSCPSDKGLLCQSVKDSVMRAIKLASPLVNLHPEDYSSWQEIRINFSTKNK